MTSAQVEIEALQRALEDVIAAEKALGRFQPKQSPAWASALGGVCTARRLAERAS